MKTWLQDSDRKIYSKQNDEKFVVAGRFISTLKYKPYKYMNAISKNVNNDKSGDIFDKQYIP